MKWIIRSKKIKVIHFALLAILAFSSSSIAFAGHCKKRGCHHPEKIVQFKDEMMPMMFIPHWYVGGHVGVSRTHDNASTGSGNSVTQIGPGWTADLGYKFTEWYMTTFAAELGYTQYHASTENTLGLQVASTEHFAAYLAAVAEHPIINNFSILGKLGVAYSYAKKVFTGSGASGSANSYSPYYGVGLAYGITSNAELVLQWMRARGNNSTGSTDLTSLGLTYNFI